MVASVMIVTPDIDQRLDCGATAAWAAGAVRRSIGLGDACDATRVERAGRGACVRRQRGPCARVPETDMRTLSSVFLESSPGSLSRLRKRNIFTLGSAVRQVQVHSYGCGCDISDIAARKSSRHGVAEGGGGRRLLPDPAARGARCRAAKGAGRPLPARSAQDVGAPASAHPRVGRADGSRSACTYACCCCVRPVRKKKLGRAAPAKGAGHLRATATRSSARRPGDHDIL